MKNNKKGFTLAELLIVVAIIGVLVAISIPIFTSQLKKARLATNQANARAAYAAAVAERLDATDNSAAASYTYTVSSATIDKDATAATGSISNDIAAWSVDDYGNQVASAWQVCFAADDTVTFNVTY